MVNVVETHPPQTFSVGKVVVETARARHDHRFAYSKAPVEVEPTQYYLRAIACGDLIAADPETARAAGVKFKDPEKVLSEARQAAIEHFNATTGDDAHAAMQDIFDHDGEPIWVADLEALEALEAPEEPNETTNAPKGSL
jgi:hypothetical protein